MHERGYERDLKLDLFSTQRGRGRQPCDLGERARKLFDRLNQGGARHGPLSGPAPQSSGFFVQASLRAVTCQYLRLVLDNVGEATFDGFHDAGMQRAARLAQQRAIGRVLYQCVLEQIGRVGRHPLSEQQTSGNDTVK